MLTKKDLKTHFIELGIANGDVLVVFSSFSNLGNVDGAEDAVIDALLEVVGASGTVVVPTYTYSDSPFNPTDTPSLMGEITEVFRIRPNAIRSLHPTHSIAAIGALADVITENHEQATAFGRGSAFYKVLQAGGKILLLGVSHSSNTVLHVAEEIANLPYLDRSKRVTMALSGDKLIHKWIRRPGCSYGFEELGEALEKENLVNSIIIGSTEAKLMSARSIIDYAVNELETNSEALLCLRPDCESCAEARAMIFATEADRQDNQVIESAEEEERMRRMLEKKFETGEVRFLEVDKNTLLN